MSALRLTVGLLVFGLIVALIDVRSAVSDPLSAGGAVSLGSDQGSAGMAKGRGLAKKQDKKKKELPKSGTLASSTTTGYTSRNFDMAWGTESGQERAPLSGSVSRTSQSDWVAKIFNNSEDKYSASILVVQFDGRATRLKSDSFSVLLKPGEHSERVIKAAPGSVDAQVNLESWRNLTPKRKENTSSGSEASSATSSTPSNAPQGAPGVQRGARVAPGK